jgi:nucleotide-binding universal stress UspA family protein
MSNRILVPIDGSPRSNRAIKAAAKLARGNGGKLTLFHATPTYRTPLYAEGYAFDWPPESVYLKESAATAAKLLARAKKVAATQKVTATVVQSRSDAPAQAILTAARKARASMIVMASHGRTGLEKLLLGSETQKVLAKSKLPVLVVR